MYCYIIKNVTKIYDINFEFYQSWLIGLNLFKNAKNFIIIDKTYKIWYLQIKKKSHLSCLLCHFMILSNNYLYINNSSFL